MLLHLGLQLGVPLLVTLHTLDLIRENVTRSVSGNDYCHNECIRE